MFRSKLIVANWKLHPKTPREALQLFSATEQIAGQFRSVDIVVCPPFVYIPALLGNASRVAVGSQDVSSEQEGAFTGEVAASMVQSIGAKFAIVGHSERRNVFGESEDVIRKKVLLALQAGLHVILCVGEKQGDAEGEFIGIIKKQLQSALTKIPKKLSSRITIAYEPVWAIGSGKPDTPENTREVVIYIKKLFYDMFGKKVSEGFRVLYGGSVIPENAGVFLEEANVDGLLVGGSSLNMKRFEKIVSIAANIE